MTIHHDKIRVLHTNPYWLRYNENWIYHQVNNLPDSVINNVFCQRTTNLDLFPVENIFKLSKTGFTLQKYLRKMQLKPLQINLHRKRLLKTAVQQQIDIIHSHFGHFGWSDMISPALKKFKHVVTFYGADVTQLPRKNKVWHDRYKELFQEADLILCEGTYMAKRIKELGCEPSKVRVHHLGVNVENIDFHPRKWNRKESLKILIASSFREKKGIPYAIRALGLLAKEINIEITIIGDASGSFDSAKEKARILKAINDMKLTEKVRFLGIQPYNVLIKESYLHHLFISTSVTASDGDSEGGAPVVLIDMAATGIPIVSSFHCDIPEVIIHEETGRLAIERNVNDIYDQIRWYIDNTHKWDDLLIKARKRMEMEYNAKTQGRRLFDLYRNLI